MLAVFSTDAATLKATDWPPTVTPGPELPELSLSGTVSRGNRTKFDYQLFVLFVRRSSVGFRDNRQPVERRVDCEVSRKRR